MDLQVKSSLKILSDAYNVAAQDFDWDNADWDKLFEHIDEIKQSREEAIELVSIYTSSKKLTEKIFGITLAGQLMNPVEKGEEAEARSLIRILARMVNEEVSIDILDAIAIAFGYPFMNETKETLLKLSRQNNDRVRLSATQSLGSLTIDEDNADILTRLSELKSDSNPEIKDWAIFNLKDIG